MKRFDVGDLFCSELRQYVIVDDLLIEMQRCRRHRDRYSVKVLRYEVSELQAAVSNLAHIAFFLEQHRLTVDLRFNLTL